MSLDCIIDFKNHESTRVKYVFNLRSGYGFPDRLQGRLEGDVPFYKVSDINGHECELAGSNNWANMEDVVSERWVVIPEKAVVFAKIGEALRKNHRKITTSTCLIDNNMMAAIPRDLESRYVYYLLCSFNMDWFVNPGAVPSLNVQAFRNAYVPKLDQQSKGMIADFLDRKTSMVDALITEKERLVALLQEQRQATITEAVTQGLDPTVPMKDSGVEWIGQVPEHWKVMPLIHVARDFIAGPFGSSLTKDMYTPEGYKVYGQEHVIANDLGIGDYYISGEKYVTMSRYKVLPGDLLLSCVGTYGRVLVVPEYHEPGIINPRLILMRLYSDSVPEYIAELLGSSIAVQQFDMLSRGGTMGVINIGLLKRMLCPIPPHNEQKAILRYILDISRDTSILVSQLTDQVEKLVHYRHSLVTEAVTGKIDVRGEAVP